MSTYGEELAARRQSVGATQRELAAESGVHQVTIAKIESGKATNLRMQTIAKLDEALARLAERVHGEHIDNLALASALPDADEPYIDIPCLDVAVSAGPGADRPDCDDIISMIRISKAWLSANVIAAHNRLAIITARGDSMKPTIEDGDLLLVDTSAGVNTDAIFVFSVSDQLFVKRLQRLPDGSVLAISDNQRYKDYPLTPQTNILGKIVFIWHGEKP